MYVYSVQFYNGTVSLTLTTSAVWEYNVEFLFSFFHKNSSWQSLQPTCLEICLLTSLITAFVVLHTGQGMFLQLNHNTVNSRLADPALLRTITITDKIQIPIYRGLTENGSRYYGLSLFRTQNNVPKVSTITRVDCNCNLFIAILNWVL